MRSSNSQPSSERGGPRTIKAASPHLAALREEWRIGGLQRLGADGEDGRAVEYRLGADSFWLATHGQEVSLFIRAAHWPGGGAAQAERRPGGWRLTTPIGRFDIEVEIDPDPAPIIRWRTTLTPAFDLSPSVGPRDLYVLGPMGEPDAAEGRVEAAQRGLNTGLVFFTLRDAQIGAALYLQDLTVLGDWFEALDAKPDGVVGGTWPELGYQPPNSPKIWGQPTRALKAGTPLIVSQAHLCLSGPAPDSELARAKLFLEGLGRIYPRLKKPTPQHHDWPGRAVKTLADLSRSPKALVTHWGEDFVRPYVDAEYPDSMVQLAVLAAIVRHDRWRGRTHPLAERLRAGVSRFRHARTGGIERYLSNVGADKNAEEVDSWYLYHPLMNLARLAQWGDDEARTLFFASLNYAIRAAQHFDYVWPVKFSVVTFEVITKARNETGLGQTDVGGLYAYVMLQAYELSGETIYLEEARRALRRMAGLGFELVYQTDLTAWGAAACVRLARITDEPQWMEQTHVFLASFFHNTLMWESRIGAAASFPNFLGATCLHDAPYMAVYECHESAAAFDEILLTVDDEIDASALLLMAEYRRFGFDRSWSYYPDALPKGALAEAQRNGHIDPKLSFPLEDLYADGQPAGQVGQEVYGCGAALHFATAGFHRVAQAPFMIFCDYPLIIEPDEADLTLHVRGASQGACKIRIIDAPSGARLRLRTEDGAELKARRIKGLREFEVPGRASLRLSWSGSADARGPAKSQPKRIRPKRAQPKRAKPARAGSRPA